MGSSVIVSGFGKTMIVESQRGPRQNVICLPRIAQCWLSFLAGGTSWMQAQIRRKK